MFYFVLLDKFGEVQIQIQTTKTQKGMIRRQEDGQRQPNIPAERIHSCDLKRNAATVTASPLAPDLGPLQHTTPQQAEEVARPTETLEVINHFNLKPVKIWLTQSHSLC